MSPEASLLAEQHGGHWKENDEFPLALWQEAVAVDDTRLGYWDWVLNQIEITTGINPVKPTEDEIDDPMIDKTADHIDGYDRDDLGESPDY